MMDGQKGRPDVVGLLKRELALAQACSCLAQADIRPTAVGHLHLVRGAQHVVHDLADGMRIGDPGTLAESFPGLPDSFTLDASDDATRNSFYEDVGTTAADEESSESY